MFYQFVIAVLRSATATANLRLPDGTEGQLNMPFLIWLLLALVLLWVREMNKPRNA